MRALDEAQQGGVALALNVLHDDAQGVVVRGHLAREAGLPPEGGLIGHDRLDDGAHGHALLQAVTDGGQVGLEMDAAHRAWRRGHDDEAGHELSFVGADLHPFVVLADLAHRGAQDDALPQLGRHARGDLVHAAQELAVQHPALHRHQVRQALAATQGVEEP